MLRVAVHVAILISGPVCLYRVVVLRRRPTWLENVMLGAFFGLGIIGLLTMVAGKG